MTSLKLNIDENKILNLLLRLSHLKKIQIFNKIPESKLIDICKIMKKEKFKEGEFIFNEGSEGDKLYLIYKGRVKVYKEDKFLRELEEGNCFGEVSLLLNEMRTATTIASTNTSIYSLTKADFLNYIDKYMLDYLVKKISLLDNFALALEDFYYIKSLGEGKFGSVSLVHNEKNIYAIKQVSRKTAEKKKILIKYFIKERNILLSLDHPFIMKLVRTLKNDDFIFYLMEFVNGITMSKYLDKRPKESLLNKSEVQFFAACLLITIDYLNSKKVCHRDLKPDNIMIDEKVFIMTF